MSDVSTMLGQDCPKSPFVLLDAGAVLRRIAIADRQSGVPVESLVVDGVPELYWFFISIVLPGTVTTVYQIIRTSFIRLLSRFSRS